MRILMAEVDHRGIPCCLNNNKAIAMMSESFGCLSESREEYVASNSDFDLRLHLGH